MTELFVTLFGPPVVSVGTQPVAFSYRKAAALFYYLILNKQIPRSEAANLLWGDSDTASSLKNLRHAVYTIRKNLGFDIFTTGHPTMLQVRDDLVCHCDVLDFMKDGTLTSDQKEFMEGFTLQHCEAFEEWMNEQRRMLHSRYLEMLLSAEQGALQKGDMETAERLGLRYVRQDPLEESAAVMLMELYRSQKKYRRAIGVYQELCKNLSAELSISPLKETSDLYYAIIDEWNSSTQRMEQESSQLLIGKSSVLNDVLALCNRPLTESRIPCAIISGDAGVGKTYMLDHVLNDYDFSDWLICRSYCYQSEDHTPLAPWNAIMMTLMTELDAREFSVPENFRKTAAALFPCLSCGHDFVASDLNYPLQQNYHVAQESALLIFASVVRRFPILLVFEDIHWMDKNSIEFLSAFLHRLKNLNITVLCTTRNIYPDYVRNFIDSAKKDHIASLLSIRCFNKEETALFSEYHLKRPPAKEMVEQIYERTGGNALLLVQLMNILDEHPELSDLSNDLGDIIGSRLSNLAPEERQVLDLISVFPDRAPFETLSSILTKDPMELMYLCNQLQSRMLIQEDSRDDALAYSLTHELIRSSLIKQQSVPARRVLHSRVAQYLENSIRQDSELPYDRLIYHYSESGDRFKVFQYRVLSLNAYTGLHYAVLPTLENGIDSSTELQNISDYFHMLEDQLAKLRWSYQPNRDRLDQLEMTLLLAKSRYTIYVGQYEPGLDALDRLTKLCTDTGNTELLMRAQVQYIYYGIQTYNTQAMATHLSVLRELLAGNERSEEFCIYLRMEGLLQLMSGNYALSRTMFQQSIDTFRSLAPVEDGRYAINIAGAYNYIAESYRMESDYHQAFLAYDQAILYNRSRGYYPGSAVFYTNYGVAAAQSGEKVVARQLFSFALETYREAHEYSGRPIALSYLAYYEAEEGNYDLAAEYIKEAEQVSDMIGSPLWKSVVYYQCWRIHVMLDRENRDVPVLQKLWTSDIHTHSLQCLSELRSIASSVPTKDVSDALADLEQFLA